MGKFRVVPSFSAHADVDWAIWMHLVIAAAAGYGANTWLHLDAWWSAAIAVGLFAAMTAVLWTRVAWLAAILGTPAGAFIGGVVGAIVLGIFVRAPTRTEDLAAAIPGALVGGALTARAYIHVARRRRDRAQAAAG